jgi:hypothetical protein
VNPVHADLTDVLDELAARTARFLEETDLHDVLDHRGHLDGGEGGL